MIVFLMAVVALVLGYAVYGRIVEKVFATDEKRVTPAVSKCDNVDYMVLPTWRVFLIQFLNIAGLGPAGLMTVVCVTYIMYDKIGFRLPLEWSIIAGTVTAFVAVVCFVWEHRK